LDDEVELLDAGEQGHFLDGKADNHLMTPFQCELCHFTNVMSSDSMGRELEDP
jgi:hypothetical protein